MRMRSMKFICMTILLAACFPGAAHESAFGTSEPMPMALLLIDGTKTFSSTVQVGALAGAVRGIDGFDLSVCFADGGGLYEDPMAAATETPSGIYDLVVILPRGLDDGTANTVWVVTEVLPWTSPERWSLVSLLSDLINRVFAGSATAVDPTEDLWPSLLASVYRNQGWLR